MHSIPTYSSWLNQVERFFALITDKAIRRGSFGSVKQLIRRIDQFVSRYNENCKPFMWIASADSILAKLQRLCSRISGTEHQVCPKDTMLKAHDEADLMIGISFPGLPRARRWAFSLQPMSRYSSNSLRNSRRTNSMKSGRRGGRTVSVR